MLAGSPEVRCVDDGKHYVVLKCPYCAERHYHGRAEGIRIAHCMPAGRGLIGYKFRLEVEDAER